MSYLHKVVDFCPAANACFTHASPIDASVRLNLNIVLNDRRPGLHDLAPMSGVVLGKSEPISAHYNAVLQDHVVANSAKLANNGVRVGDKVVADLGAAIDHAVCKQHSVVADLEVFADHHVGSDVGIRANPGRWSDDSGGVDSVHSGEGDRTAQGPEQNPGKGSCFAAG